MTDGLATGAAKAESGGSGGSLRAVLITGASRGLGRVLALELARRGHTVVGLARSEENMASLREECPRPTGQRHLFTALDVMEDSGLKELAGRVVEAGLVPDIIVNNAAIINKNNKLWDIPLEEADMVIDINIKGSINVLRHFLPILIKKGHGIVVNMSSVWGRTVGQNVAPYCTTKWAVEGLSRAVAMEVPPGIAIVALDPGAIDTDMFYACNGFRATHFISPNVWAPIAADMILNFTTEDNGASPTVKIE